MLIDWVNVTKFAQYNNFYLEHEKNLCRIHIDNYSSNAGSFIIFYMSLIFPFTHLQIMFKGILILYCVFHE